MSCNQGERDVSVVDLERSAVRAPVPVNEDLDRTLVGETLDDVGTGEEVAVSDRECGPGLPRAVDLPHRAVRGACVDLDRGGERAVRSEQGKDRAERGATTPSFAYSRLERMGMATGDARSRMLCSSTERASRAANASTRGGRRRGDVGEHGVETRGGEVDFEAGGYGALHRHVARPVRLCCKLDDDARWPSRIRAGSGICAGQMVL